MSGILMFLKKTFACCFSEEEIFVGQATNNGGKILLLEKNCNIFYTKNTMLTWAGFVGKLIDFILSKIAGKKVDLALDEKKQAAKAFVRFHESTLALEKILNSFLTYIETFIANRNSKIYTSHIEGRVTYNLQEASTEFLKSMESLSPVLNFYDPNLYNLFGNIRNLKGPLFKNILWFFNASLLKSETTRESILDYYQPDINALKNADKVIKFTTTHTDSYSNIQYTIPGDDILQSDFNVLFNKSLSLQRDNMGSRELEKLQAETIELIISKITSGDINYDDKDGLIVLYQKLKEHKAILTRAREGLREFIEKNFSLADVLYVTK